MPRVLVTGAAGFIGSHVAEHCLGLGFDVVGVDDLSGGFVDNVPEGVDFRAGSVTDAEFVASLWAGGRFDYVYHLAAYAAEGLSHFIRRFNYETNLIGSINLINESVRNDVGCFVFTSSIAVYGSGQTPMIEAMTPHPEDPYGVSKLAVELDLEAAHRMFGLPYVIFRPHNVYGERQNIADRYRNVVGIFMRQALAGDAMTIFGDGRQTRAFSYITDVAGPIARSPLAPNAYQQTFNVGADDPCTVLQLASAVSRALGTPPRIAHLDARHEVVHAVASHEKARQVFGDAPRVSLASGLERMAAWARGANGRAPIDITAITPVEIARGMPRSWLSDTA